MRFVVTSVGVEPNVRGLPMRRVQLKAVGGDEFQSDEPLPEFYTTDGKVVKTTAPEPEGSITLLLGAKAAKRFSVGDAFDVAFHERG